VVGLEPQLWLFASLTLVAAYVQTVSGFALGLIVMGAVGPSTSPHRIRRAGGERDLAGQRGQRALGRWHCVDRRTLRVAAAAMVPAVLGGLALLDWLQTTWVDGLRGLLGGFILAGGCC